jgi:hypothetical protein
MMGYGGGYTKPYGKERIMGVSYRGMNNLPRVVDEMVTRRKEGNLSRAYSNTLRSASVSNI